MTIDKLASVRHILVDLDGTISEMPTDDWLGIVLDLLIVQKYRIMPKQAKNNRCRI